MQSEGADRDMGPSIGSSGFSVGWLWIAGSGTNMLVRGNTDTDSTPESSSTSRTTPPALPPYFAADFLL
jgi:hypothetical protein